MLEQIRRNHRLGTVVLVLCAILWLVALLAGVRARPMAWPAASVALQATMALDALGNSYGRRAHQATQASAVIPGEHGGAMSSSHCLYAPDCLLCLALSPPVMVVLQIDRSPVPVHGPVWPTPVHFPHVVQASAPLPARGPPARFLG